MTALTLAAALALLAAAGHSVLSERLFLRPMRSETLEDSVFHPGVAKRLVSAMFHLASVCWAGMAIVLLGLEPAGHASPSMLHVFAAIFLVSGLGNFWATRRMHPGGVLLCSAGALVLAGLYV